MKVSVCMGIYNGEKFIEKQLKTIYRQTRQADEVILCDDCSTDKSVEIVRKFIQRHGLEESWKLYQNTENKGYPGNFYYAMSLCTGDVVFLADQDDLWVESKIEQMYKVFAKYGDANLVCCKFGLIDEKNQKIRSIMRPVRSRETGKVCKVSIERCFRKCEWPGMVLAYRRDWYDKKRKNVDGQLMIPHDFLLAAWAAEENSFLQLDRELAYHRRHDNNVGGEEHKVGKVLNKQRKLNEIDDYLALLNEFNEKNVLVTKEGKDVLQQKVNSMRSRKDALVSRKIGSVLSGAWKHRNNIRPATLICDILIVKR